MRNEFIETENVRRLARVINAVTTAGPGQSRMGLVTGRVGLGKSWAVDDAYVNRGCLYVRACATWTPNAILKAILRKCGLQPAVSAAQNLERAASLLIARTDAVNPAKNLLIIDEADYLIAGAKQGTPPVLLDTVRDLYDLSHAPVILVGEPELAGTLHHYSQASEKYKRFWDRICTAEEFQPVSAAEIQTMSARLTGLEMPLESAESLQKSQDGNLRLVIIALRVAERMAKVNKLPRLPPELVHKAEEKVRKEKHYVDARKRALTRRAA